MNITPEIQALIQRGALFAVNHSGGKDSQAMLIQLAQVVPASQLLVVHASLGEVEWHGALELAQAHAAQVGAPFVVAKAIWADGSEKTLLNMVEDRFAKRPDAPSWPSKSCRNCTSDLKRGPIEREIRRFAKAHGFKLIVNCEGIRADESADRSKYTPWEQRGGKNDGLARAGRQAWNWLPIFRLTTAQVFEVIGKAGATAHPAYAAGNERLSCVFCIFGSQNDIALGAKARPELFAKYVELENRTGYTMHMNRKSLTQIVQEAAL